MFLARFGSRMPAHLGRGFCLFVPTILAHTGLYLGHLILRGDRPHSKVVLTGLLLAADFAGVGMGQIAQNVNLPVSILVAARRDFFAFRRALHPAVLAMHIVKAILGAGGSLLVVNGPLVLQLGQHLGAGIAAHCALLYNRTGFAASSIIGGCCKFVRCDHTKLGAPLILALLSMAQTAGGSRGLYIRPVKIVGIGVNRNRLCLSRSAHCASKPFAAWNNAGRFAFNCPNTPIVVPSCRNILCLYETTASACAGLLTISTAGSVTLNLPLAKGMGLQLFVPAAAIYTQPGVAFFGHNQVAGIGVVQLGNAFHLIRIPD